MVHTALAEDRAHISSEEGLHAVEAVPAQYAASDGGAGRYDASSPFGGNKSPNELGKIRPVQSTELSGLTIPSMTEVIIANATYISQSRGCTILFWGRETLTRKGT